MNLANQKDVHLMTWEIDPNKRNQNNIITFNLLKKSKIEVGDNITVNLGNGKFSVYQILEIKEKRQSSLKDYDYITATTQWSIQ